jgi:hypothetical protein
MFGVYGIIASGIVIFLWEGIRLFKQKKVKEMIVFSLSLLIAMTIYMIVVLRLPIPTPTELIENLLEPIIKPIVLWTGGGST